MKLIRTIIQYLPPLLMTILTTFLLVLTNCSRPCPSDTPTTIFQEPDSIDGETISEGQIPNEEIIIPWDIEKPFLLTYKILATYPHDKDAFTQGLFFHDGLIYESTGLWEKSSVRIADLTTGSILLMRGLPSNYNDMSFSNLFGEGLTYLNSELYQLTWQNGICFVYDSKNLSLKRVYKYNGEGWGLTYDGTFLIRSDGTNTLYFHHPENFKISHTIDVYENNNPIKNLNELEFIEGYICANVWKTNSIVVIDPLNGNLVGKILLEGLINEQNNPKADVLNGIAYIPERKTLLVTGKLWDTIFEIALVKVKHIQ